MQNYLHKGDVLNFAPAANVTAGSGVIIGAMLGVAVTDVAATALGAFAVEGVFTLPKLGTDVVNPGDALIWDKANGRFKKTGAASGDLLVAAKAESAAGNGTTVVNVKLTPGGASVSP